MDSQISTISMTIENPKNQPKEETTDIEKAMEICGTGRYQYTFLLTCGMLFICVGLQYGINAYILPSAECDFNMRSEQKGFLNVAFLGGCVFSAFFWGIFAGVYGRRNIILLTLFTDSILSIITSFSPSYNVFLIFRVISGFMMGAPGSLIYTYLGEFHEDKSQTKSICFLGFFWPLAWLILAGLAWIFIPLPINYEFYGIHYNSWRTFLAFIGIPTFIIAMIILLKYSESPKFLVSQGRTDEALAILRKIYAVNNRRDENEYPVKELLSDIVLEAKKDGVSSCSIHSLTDIMKNIWRQLRTILSPPQLKYAIIVWTIYASNMFGYYGLGLWMPELFNRFENYQHLHPNASVTICELSDIHPSLNLTIADEPFYLLNKECKPNIDERVFINSLSLNAVSLPANIISGILASRVDRRTIPVITMLLAGASNFGIYFMNSSQKVLMMACVSTLMLTMSNFMMAGVAVNIFPTHVAAAAVSMMICLGRASAVASNLIFGLLLDFTCEIPLFMLAGIVIFGGIVSFLIPNKKKK
ncbi:synaptic vesicle glycoprotein 2C-like [Odontomachus brunneus]|uniref:synaptic vesicle glycoprotein 2C-like n=1 Tax=Odontomachus brunneus TaxID=486640 RepID=UPI0013F288C9|nr:synaptic vesicle glycoprotein 2C-like [Odontomachus brunneus]